MNAFRTNRLPLALAAALVLMTLFAFSREEPAQAQQRGGKAAAEVAGPHYTVVETEGHNLIVTDNKSNTVYFYTIDKDKEIGSELKLRGSVDLTQVGKPTIKPTKPGE
jgi:hypothetical protein